MNFIDLFAGEGGLSEGFLREGFTSIAHIEMNKEACDTLKTRTAYHYLKSKKKLNIYNSYLKKEISREELYAQVDKNELDAVINVEISDDTIGGIFERIDGEISRLSIKNVDLIIGGPPCQAYSLIGRSRDPNRKEGDPKNFLYKQYMKFLIKYKPKMFVFENVVGLKSAKGGEYLKEIQKESLEAGYITKFKELNAFDFGVLQNRKRVIIVGWRMDSEMTYPEFEKVSINNATVWDLFNDLPQLKAGETYTGLNYRDDSSEYLEKSFIRNEKDILTWHITRPHLPRDLEIYSLAVDVWNKEKRRIKYNELPNHLINHKNIKTFLDRFKVVAGDLNHSHTMVAHISRDGHHFIHPDINQNRSLSVREAARIQSFPDNYFFEGSRTAAFTQIGNAVPPLMGQGIAKKIKEYIV